VPIDYNKVSFSLLTLEFKQEVTEEWCGYSRWYLIQKRYQLPSYSQYQETNEVSEEYNFTQWTKPSLPQCSWNHCPATSCHISHFSQRATQRKGLKQGLPDIMPLTPQQYGNVTWTRHALWCGRYLNKRNIAVLFGIVFRAEHTLPAANY
jgi:hypothetical protein